MIMTATIVSHISVRVSVKLSGLQTGLLNLSSSVTKRSCGEELLDLAKTSNS